VNTDPLAFRDWLLARMIESIEATETNPVHKAGCLEGVELCRTLNEPVAYVNAIAERYRAEQALAHAYEDAKALRRVAERDAEGQMTAVGTELDPAKQAALDAYWHHRCATAQIEHVWARFMFVWPGAFPADGSVTASVVRDVYNYVTSLGAASA
jgi:hypothetical protein